jgi:ribosomal protein L16/L10AE
MSERTLEMRRNPNPLVDSVDGPEVVRSHIGPDPTLSGAIGGRAVVGEAEVARVEIERIRAEIVEAARCRQARMLRREGGNDHSMLGRELRGG